MRFFIARLPHSIILFLCFSLALFLVFSFFSCRSAMNYAVPGVQKITLKDLHTEYMLIGDEYAALEKYDKAIEYYTKALGNKEIYWTAYYKLGRTYALAAKWEKACEVYGNLLERDEENIDLLRSMAYIKGMSGQLNEAMDIYNSLLEKNADDETTLVNAAAVMLAQKQNDTARIYIDILKERFPESKSLDRLAKTLSDALKADTVEEDSWEEYEKSL